MDSSLLSPSSFPSHSSNSLHHPPPSDAGRRLGYSRQLFSHLSAKQVYDAGFSRLIALHRRHGLSLEISRDKASL